MASPVFFIKKKDGALRLVQDYRALNTIMVKNKYPLPLISELIEKLQGTRYFTKLDIQWGSNNVRMKEGDEWEVQSFLRFINFSHNAHPLFNLTKNDVKWSWSTDEQSAFDILKSLVTSAPILTSPDNSQPFCIEADSSDFTTSEMLFAGLSLRLRLMVSDS